MRRAGSSVQRRRVSAFSEMLKQSSRRVPVSCMRDSDQQSRHELIKPRIDLPHDGDKFSSPIRWHDGGKRRRTGSRAKPRENAQLTQVCYLGSRKSPALSIVRSGGAAEVLESVGGKGGTRTLDPGIMRHGWAQENHAKLTRSALCEKPTEGRKCW